MSEYDAETLLTRTLLKGMIDFLVNYQQIESFVSSFAPEDSPDYPVEAGSDEAILLESGHKETAALREVETLPTIGRKGE